MALGDLVGRLLPTLDLAFPTTVLGELTRVLSETAGAEQVSLWLADYDQDLLGGLSGPAGIDVDERIPVGAGPIGEAYATQRTVTVHEPPGVWVHTPVTLRGDRIGVLSVACPDAGTGTASGRGEGDSGLDGIVEGLGQVALTLAYVLSLAPRYTDAFEQARRRQPLSVAAEMQWSVLPARAFASPEFSLAGALIPAYDVGGDVYDFAVDPDRLWTAAIDAMGHGVQASVLAALATHTLRNARRGGAGVLQQVDAADRALVDVFGGAQFVTGLVLEVELDSGRCRFVNAGHPSPLLARGGTVRALAETPNVPMGLFTDSTFSAIDLQLEPGDRLLLVSDGVVEAALDGSGQYGDAHLAEQFLATGSLPPQQAVRAIQRHLVDTAGERLHDDATLFVIDWYRPEPHRRRPA